MAAGITTNNVNLSINIDKAGGAEVTAEKSGRDRSKNDERSTSEEAEDSKKLAEGIIQREAQKRDRLDSAQDVILDQDSPEGRPGLEDRLANLGTNELQPETHDSSQDHRASLARAEDQLPGVILTLPLHLEHLEMDRLPMRLFERNRHMMGMNKKLPGGALDLAPFEHIDALDANSLVRKLGQDFPQPGPGGFKGESRFVHPGSISGGAQV